ncbi:YbhB/YbcL family Raf kinase inhibitor-like protein [Candidatus Parcubacteria bacterium]|nr:YbhB/YbcL family Raf kinase inhibitor-like protein [Candidatus Parcubacteria bacterium]
MQLTSKDFENNQVMADKFTCRGENCSPQLNIKDVPQDAQSLCLILHDPDAVGSDFTHWLVWNIDPKTTVIEENSLPIGSMEGTNDFGNAGYGGPCPPAGTGTHRYIFELYALDTTLKLSDTTTEDQLRSAIESPIIDHAVLTGLVSSE